MVDLRHGKPSLWRADMHLNSVSRILTQVNMTNRQKHNTGCKHLITRAAN